MKTEQITNTRTGRPRGFDEDAALDAAMRLFWEKSYDGATLSELTEAMGINRSSMWAAFGNKEALFKLAVDRYASIHMAYLAEALTLNSIREVVQAMIRGTVAFLSTPGNPKGCLLYRVPSLQLLAPNRPKLLYVISGDEVSFGCAND